MPDLDEMLATIEGLNVAATVLLDTPEDASRVVLRQNLQRVARNIRTAFLRAEACRYVDVLLAELALFEEKINSAASKEEIREFSIRIQDLAIKREKSFMNARKIRDMTGAFIPVRLLKSVVKAGIMGPSSPLPDPFKLWALKTNRALSCLLALSLSRKSEIYACQAVSAVLARDLIRKIIVMLAHLDAAPAAEAGA